MKTSNGIFPFEIGSKLDIFFRTSNQNPYFQASQKSTKKEKESPLSHVKSLESALITYVN
jgi:hypothetical protein